MATKRLDSQPRMHIYAQRLLLLVLLFWVMIGGASAALTAQASATTIALPAYLAELKQAASTLENNPTAATVQQLQEELAAIQQVILADGSTIPVKPLLGTAAESVPSSAAAQQRLAVTIAQLEAAPLDQMAERLALLETIFARAEFVGRDTLWDRFWRWLRSFLPDSSPEGAAAAPLIANGITLIGWLVIGVGTLLLIYLLSFWLQKLLGTFVRGAGPARGSDPAADPRNAAEARQQAHQFAADGSFREAVRRMYLSALLTLDEHALLRYDRSSTNREVLSTIQKNQPLYQRLQPVIEIFDEVWYGVHEPDRATFERYVQAVERLPTDGPDRPAGPAAQKSEQAR